MTEVKAKYSSIVLILCFICAMWPSYSYAHRMLIDCMVEDGAVFVDAFFPDGKPAKNVKVEVYKSDETLYLSGETDAEGQFSFDPGNEGHLKIVATGKLGHRAEQEVSLKRIEPEPAGGTEEAVPSGSERRGTLQPAPTTRRASIPFREIFAGFGYILGVAGILMYLKARSDLKKAKS